MTATIADSDVLEALDWHPELPCEAKSCRTPDQPARWRVRGTLPCGHGAHVLMCTPCAGELLAYLNSVSDDWKCTVCQKHHNGNPRAHFHFEPLP